MIDCLVIGKNVILHYLSWTKTCRNVGSVTDIDTLVAYLTYLVLLKVRL